MEPFEKIHIRAHLHGSRAKPSAGLTDPFKAVRPLNVSRAASSMQFFLSIAATSRPSYYVFLSECREREKSALFFPTKNGKRVKRPSRTKKQYRNANVAPRVVSSKFQTWSLDSRHAFYPPCATRANKYVYIETCIEPRFERFPLSIDRSWREALCNELFNGSPRCLAVPGKG